MKTISQLNTLENDSSMSLEEMLQGKKGTCEAAKDLRNVQDILAGFMPEVKRIRRNDNPSWVSTEHTSKNHRRQ